MDPSKEADMYAFGMVIYVVVTGTRPRTPIRPEDPVAVGFVHGTWEFAEKCWDGNRERRPTAREALEHFEGVAKTSAVVDPGPTIHGDGAASEDPSESDGEFPSESDSDSVYCECRRPNSVFPF